jgi:glycosyltransferase involved in cell wall biosynthesis
MPPSVTYWSGTWEPTREAISKEVETLRRASHPLAPVVSLASRQKSSISARDRVIRLAGSRWMTFRAAAACIEPLGDVTHVFGAMNAWHQLKALGRRPIVFTVALPGPALEPALYDKVTTFVAESECLADDLRKAGVSADRIRIIYPGVDLQEFQPVTQRSRDRFHILFASSPAHAGEFEARGIALLVEMARLCPEIDVTLLWRSWGDQDAARRAFAALNPTSNIRIDQRRGRTMAQVYQDADAIACLYEPGFGKSCPNSVIEAMACGLPALVSSACGIGSLIDAEGAGIAVARNAFDAAAAARVLQQEHARFRAAARRLAERHFDIRQFVEAYARLYEATATVRSRTASRSSLPLHPPSSLRSSPTPTRGNSHRL